MRYLSTGVHALQPCCKNGHLVCPYRPQAKFYCFSSSNLRHLTAFYFLVGGMVVVQAVVYPLLRIVGRLWW